MGILDMIGWLFVNFASWIGSTTTQREAIANPWGAGVSDPGCSVMR